MIFRRQLNGLRLGIIRTNISHEKVVQTRGYLPRIYRGRCIMQQQLHHVLCAIVKATLLNHQSSSESHNKAPLKK